MSDDASETAVVARRAGLLALGTLGSRIFGALRDAVIAATFAVAATDAFWLAFTLPNALRVLLGEGAVSAMVVPVFTETRERQGPEAARLLFARLAGTMLVVLAGVAALGVVAAPLLVRLYAAGFDADTTAQAVTLTRWVFPYIALMGAAALATGALHASGRFTAPAFAPVLLNVAFIAAAFTLRDQAEALGLGTVGALALGALLGGALQLAALLPSLRGAGLLVRPRPAFGDPAVRVAFRRLAPLLAGLGVYQLNVLMSRQLASFLPAGSLSYLFYGQRLVEIPQGMFALAIGSAALPTLAARHARGDSEGARALLRYGLRLALFVAIPSSVALALLATPVVGALLGRGAYGAAEVAETARSLVFLAGGVWAVAAVRTIVPMFHALGSGNKYSTFTRPCFLSK
ncbi:MAG: murein biosynthesis integral membrane protein MurJ [Myxococcota bacterium]